MSNRFCLQCLSVAVCIAFLFSSIRAATTYAQGSRLDYQRSDGYDIRTRNTIFRSDVRPQWLNKTSRFWYVVDVGPDESEFVLVDAEAGTRHAAFDHERLATALAAASGEEVRPRHLPFDSIEYIENAKSVRFQAFGGRWKCDLDSYELTRASSDDDDATESTGVRVLEAPRPSRRTGEETSVRFVNRTAGDVQLFWIDDSAERRPYGTIAAGEAREQHSYNGHVWLVVGADDEPVAVFQATEGAGVAIIDGSQRPRSGRRRGERRTHRAEPSPDGRWQPFLRDNKVHLRGLEGDEEFALSTDGTEDDPYENRFRWSPDSKTLVAMKVRKGEERTVHLIESAPADQLQPKLHSHTYDKPGDRMPVPRPRLFDVESRSRIDVPEDLYPNAWSISEMRWSPDSNRFSFLYNQRGHQLLRIIEIDTVSGEARTIIDEQSKTFVDYAHKTFTHPIDATREIIWMSERDGWNHLYLYDADSAQAKNQITHGPWVVRSVERVDDERRQIWFRAGGIRSGQDPYFVHLCRVDFDGSGLVVLTEGDGTHEWTFSPDNRFFVDSWSRVDQPPVTELRRADDGSLVCELERAECDRLLSTGWRPPQRFVAKGRDGTTDIHGIIVRPSNFDPDREYPVIEHIYAGPSAQLAVL